MGFNLKTAQKPGVFAIRRTQLLKGYRFLNNVNSDPEPGYLAADLARIAEDSQSAWSMIESSPSGSFRSSRSSADYDSVLLVKPGGVGLDGARPRDRHARTQIELPGMKRAEDGVISNESVRHRTGFVRAGGIGGKHLACSRVKDCKPLAIDLKGAAFAGRDFAKSGDEELSLVFAH